MNESPIVGDSVIGSDGASSEVELGASEALVPIVDVAAGRVDRRRRPMNPVRPLVSAMRRLHARYLLRPQLRITTWWRFGRHHAAEIDPFRSLWIDPASIGTFIEMDRNVFLRTRHDVRIVAGDWDLAAAPIAEHFVFESLRARFVDGVPWDRTRVYRVAREGILNGGPWYHGCRTTHQLDDRIREIERLYEVMRTEGYRSQADLDRIPSRQPLQRNKARPSELDEIVVHIDRDGTFVFLDGIHRLSVATIVGVPAVAVRVLFRHEAWQAYRDRVVRDPTAFPASVFAHPDLAYLRR